MARDRLSSWPWAALMTGAMHGLMPGPVGGRDLPACDGDDHHGRGGVAPHEVFAGSQARINGGVLNAARRVPLPDARVGPVARRAVGAPADLDLPGVELRPPVQDQGANVGAEVEYDAAGAGRGRNGLSHLGPQCAGWS